MNIILSDTNKQRGGHFFLLVHLSSIPLPTVESIRNGYIDLTLSLLQVGAEGDLSSLRNLASGLPTAARNKVRSCLLMG